MSAALPRVAIIGFPNVGKSTLFNRMTGTRDAVVAPEPGVTRDRKEGLTEWNGTSFLVVDTGGVDLAGEEPLGQEVVAQAKLALAESAVAVFLVEGRTGVTPQDQEIADVLRRAKVPVLLAVNKQDTKTAQGMLHELWGLGLGEPIGISAEHGLGVDVLLDAIVASLPRGSVKEETHSPVRVAIVGRPNVGKSSIVNALLGNPRTIVSEIPGTTRDAIDTTLLHDGEPIVLVDTAGLRRPGKRTTTDVEYFSSLRSLKALESSDVALVVVDASEGLVDLDLQVAYEAQRARCATAVLLNKWDVSTIDLPKVVERLQAKVQMKPPHLTVSAITGRNVERILPLVMDLYHKYAGRIPTSDLNRWLSALHPRHPAASKAGKPLKAFYMVQYDQAPPRFKVMVNSRALVNKPYAYYLENHLRDDYALEGVPLIIDFEGKEERYS